MPMTGVLKEAEMLSSERPKAFRESSTDQCSASALKNVKVGTLNDRVILRNSSSGILMHDAKCSTGKLKLRGIVGIKTVSDIVAKEIPKRPDGLLGSLVANRKKDLDIRIQILDHECVKVTKINSIPPCLATRWSAVTKSSQPLGCLLSW